MRVAYAHSKLRYEKGGTSPSGVTPNAVLHRSTVKDNPCNVGARGGYRLYSYRSAYRQNSELTQARKFSFEVAADWSPWKGPADDSVEARAAAFLQGFKLPPAWAREARYCKKCFPGQGAVETCNLGHKHETPPPFKAVTA